MTEADLRAVWESRRHTFHHDARVIGSPVLRALLLVAGVALLALGVIGAFLPVLPTTPFVLAATACFVRASPRLYDAVLSNRVVGPVAFAWRETRTIPRRAKRVAMVVVVLTFGVSIAFAVTLLWARLAMAALALGLLAWLATIPSRAPAPPPPTTPSPPHA